MVRINRYFILLLIILVFIPPLYYLYHFREIKKPSNQGIPFVNLKLKDRSVLFDRNGNLMKYEEVLGLPLIKTEGKGLLNHYDSIKYLALIFPSIQDTLKDKHLNLILDLDTGNLLLEGKNFKATIGKENTKKRIMNVITVVEKEKIEGIIDASFDSMVVVKK